MFGDNRMKFGVMLAGENRVHQTMEYSCAAPEAGESVTVVLTITEMDTHFRPELEKNFQEKVDGTR